MKCILFLLALAGCAAEPPIFKPVTVDIPVVVPCRTVPVAAPDFALAHVVATDDLFHKTQAALMELEQRKSFEVQLIAALSTCPS